MATTRRRTRSASLQTRRQPVQERAQQTVERILDTAARLLHEAGLEAFNTNLLAARAGVQVRTVYRYFPNKLAVMKALAERLAAEWDGWFEGFGALADPSRDLRTLWSGYIDAFVEGIRRTPGGLAIRHAMRVIPELQAIDRADGERLAALLAAALARRGDRRPRRELKIVARMLIETATTVLDLALLERPAQRRALLDALKSMQVSYLLHPLAAAGAKEKRP